MSSFTTKILAAQGANGTDLASIFWPLYGSTNKAPITNFFGPLGPSGTAAKTDLNDLFYKYVSGTKATATSIYSGGGDLCNIFQNINVPVPPITFSGLNGVAFNSATIDNLTYTYTSVLTTPTTTGTASLIFNYPLKLNITMFGGGGGGCASNDLAPRAGGGGGGVGTGGIIVVTGGVNATISVGGGGIGGTVAVSSGVTGGNTMFQYGSLNATAGGGGGGTAVGGGAAGTLTLNGITFTGNFSGGNGGIASQNGSPPSGGGGSGGGGGGVQGTNNQNGSGGSAGGNGSGGLAGGSANRNGVSATFPGGGGGGGGGRALFGTGISLGGNGGSGKLEITCTIGVV